MQAASRRLRTWLGVAGLVAAAVAVLSRSPYAFWIAVVLLAASLALRLRDRSAR
jgi:apolipoprotein N-acyltransferase